MSAQAKERLMKIRKDLWSMPGELPPELLGDRGHAEMGTQDQTPDRPVASGSTLGGADATGEGGQGAAGRSGFRFGPTANAAQPQQDPLAAIPPRGFDPQPSARSAFSFATRTAATQSVGESVPARERSRDSGPTAGLPLKPNSPADQEGNSEAFETPPAFEADGLDAPSGEVAPIGSMRRARFDARVASRYAGATPAFFGYQASGEEGGDQPCGIPGSAFIGYPSDLPIGTGYSRAVWSRATRQAGPGHAVLELRTAHGGSAMVVAPWSQPSETHCGNVSPWADIDRALLIEVKYRAHAEHGYRNVKVGAGGFHEETGTVEIERPDLSSLRRELGLATDRVFYATVQISADRSSPQAAGRTEREFWVVLPEDAVRRLAARGSRHHTEPRHRTLGIWHNGILSRDSGGRPELRLADANAGLLALPAVAAPDPEPGSAVDAKWTEVEGDFVLDTVERLLAGGMPTVQAEEAGIWALYEHRRLKLGLPESARPAFLVEPAGAGEARAAEPIATERGDPLVASADSQGNVDGDAAAAEPAKGVRFGFGARPRS